jgi:hypothetical protein
MLNTIGHPTSPAISGVIGFFESPDDLISATEKVRDSNYKHFDCFTPFAVHGLDKAQGLPRSRIPYVTGLFAFSGAILAFWFQYYCSKTSWAHVVGGKPFNSLPAFVPIIFECSILFGGIATFFSILGFNRLPNLTKRAFDPSLTNNRFAIVIETPPVDHHNPSDIPENFNIDDAEKFLKQVGAVDTRKVYEEGWF